MPEFRFHAPGLLAPGAAVESGSDRFHGAPGAAPANAPRKRFARWLMAGLAQHGYRPDGPEPDEDGWIVDVPSNGASAQIVIYSDLGEDPAQFVVDVLLLGPADPAIADACEAILRTSPEIRGLRIES